MFNRVNPYAFTIVISCGIVFMYLAYLGVTIPLHPAAARGLAEEPAHRATRTLFQLGGWGVVTNVIAVLYGAAMAVNLCWPRTTIYGTKWYQQYGVDPRRRIAVIVSGLILYYGFRRTGWRCCPSTRRSNGSAADERAAADPRRAVAEPTDGGVRAAGGPPHLSSMDTVSMDRGDPRSLRKLVRRDLVVLAVGQPDRDLDDGAGAGRVSSV